MNEKHIPDKNEIKSEVETALRWDCFLNLFSLDKIPQLRKNKYPQAYNKKVVVTRLDYTHYPNRNLFIPIFSNFFQQGGKR
jgi:hypothetical protein